MNASPASHQSRNKTAVSETSHRWKEPAQQVFQVAAPRPRHSRIPALRVGGSSPANSGFPCLGG